MFRYILMTGAFFPLFAQTPSVPDSVPEFAPITEEIVEAPKTTGKLEPFTGKITGSKVRLRLQPSLDGAILSELNPGDLVIITGEIDDYYAIKPEKKWRGYLYRAYILDNIIEANNVNLRLEPNTNAPVLAQFNQGEKIFGTICPQNNKWLEVDLPESVEFYVAKNYVLNIGDVALYHKIQSRRQQLAKRLTSLQENIQTEMQKPFREIQLVPFINDLKTIIAQNQDLADFTLQAENMIKALQEKYVELSQKIPQADTTTTESHIAQTDEQPTQPKEPLFSRRLASFSLERQEVSLVEQAIAEGRAVTKEDFYLNEQKTAQEQTGQLIPYERMAKNRPGDFMLVDQKTKVPVAYLYSCNVDLNQFIGQTIRLIVSPRPNHHFALPAYFVHNVRE